MSIVAESDIADWTWLIAKVARRFVNRGIPFEDLVQTGLIGFVEAVRGYEAGRGPFKAYLSLVVRREIVEAFRRGESRLIPIKRLHRKRGPGDPPPVVAIPVGDIYRSVIPAAADGPNPDDRLFATELLATLPKRDAWIMRRYYGIGQDSPMNQREIGEQMGLHKSMISLIWKRSVEDMRAFTTPPDGRREITTSHPGA